MAAPVSALVAAAVSRMGAPCWGMARGRVLEAGTVVLLILAVAVTTYWAPGVRPVNASWMEVLFCRLHCVGCALRQSDTIYRLTDWPLAGGVSSTVAFVALVAMADATVGAPSRGVRMARVLAPGTFLPELVTPTTLMVSAHGG